MDQFFSVEPYRSLRDYFNVYAVRVISENDVFFSEYAKRKFIDDNNGDPIFKPIWNYIELVPNNQSDPILTCSAVVLNYNYCYGRSFCTQIISYGHGCPFWTSNKSMSFILEPIDFNPGVINHEMGGHGFALLDDEYNEYDYTITDEYIEELDMNSWEHVNTDWRNDPKTVKWSHFLKDDRYNKEGLGIYEGSFVSKKGLFRPSEHSIMRNYVVMAFNAPCREQIYKTTMILSKGLEWEYSYEVFARFDEAGRKDAAEAFSSHVNRLASDSKGAIGLPPIRLKGSVRGFKIDKNARPIVIE